MVSPAPHHPRPAATRARTSAPSSPHRRASSRARARARSLDAMAARRRPARAEGVTAAACTRSPRASWGAGRCVAPRRAVMHLDGGRRRNRMSPPQRARHGVRGESTGTERAETAALKTGRCATGGASAKHCAAAVRRARELEPGRPARLTHTRLTRASLTRRSLTPRGTRRDSTCPGVPGLRARGAALAGVAEIPGGAVEPLTPARTSPAAPPGPRRARLRRARAPGRPPQARAA